jgi:hypothetical protein
VIHVLQILRATEVIAVAVRQDDVFDLRRIKPRFFVTGKNNVLGVVVIVQGVDLDDSGAGHQGPRGNDVRSQIVELIKHFSGRSHERNAPRRGRFRGRLAVVEIPSRQILGGQQVRCIEVILVGQGTGMASSGVLGTQWDRHHRRRKRRRCQEH